MGSCLSSEIENSKCASFVEEFVRTRGNSYEYPESIMQKYISPNMDEGDREHVRKDLIARKRRKFRSRVIKVKYVGSKRRVQEAASDEVSGNEQHYENAPAAEQIVETIVVLIFDTCEYCQKCYYHKCPNDFSTRGDEAIRGGSEEEDRTYLQDPSLWKFVVCYDVKSGTKSIERIQRYYNDAWSRRHGEPDVDVSCTDTCCVFRWPVTYQYQPIPYRPLSNTSNSGGYSDSYSDRNRHNAAADAHYHRMQDDQRAAAQSQALARQQQELARRQEQAQQEYRRQQQMAAEQRMREAQQAMAKRRNY